MSEQHQDAAATTPVVLVDKPQTCLGLHRGALVAVRRAMMTGDDLRTFRAAVETASRAHPRGLVMLAAFRLDPRFPLQAGFEADLGGFVDTLRAIDRRLVAIASVLEFGGVRAAVMRATSRAVWALGRAHSKMGSFDRVIDAAEWLAPYAQEVGACDEVGEYVRAYRHVERRLSRHDAHLVVS